MSIIGSSSQSYGYDLGMVFFGLHLAVLGYLVYRSGFQPRTRGVLMVSSALGYLAISFTLLAVPEFAQTLAVVVVAALIDELPLTLWLLIKGVNVERWHQRALEEGRGQSMSRQQQMGLLSTPRRRGRRFLVWLGGAMAVLLGLGLLGALYESMAEAADARAYAPPGQMVDVGGYRLHIICVGTGSPTVVIDYGWGDSSAAWGSSVQPEAAKTTRVCTYDRGGAGYSEAGPLPRSAGRFAQELHTLLHQGGIPGPYVVVGHSLGGLTAQVFAHEYAAEVAGVVLIDSMSPSAAKPSATGTLNTPPQTGQRSGSDWLLTLPARIGILRLLAGPSSAATAYSVTPRSVQTVIDEGRGLPEGLAEAGAVKSLGAVPLIVLSRGRIQGQDQDWQRMQSEFLQLSSNSQQLFADKSGHNIQTDQPEAAVGAIVQMVEQIRRQASR